MNMDWQKELLEVVEKALESCLQSGGARQEKVYEAMRYSLLNGGKRVRALLTLEFCKISGGTAEMALPFACAVEMVHAYSLIHDDLPCMDNADVRRGRPANHKVFGEDMAVLAGDGLLSSAFEVMLSTGTAALVGADRAAKAAFLLARASGPAGMVGGQTLDLAAEGRRLPLEELEILDSYKTGALIRAAAEMGCVAGGAGEDLLSAAREYAEALGIAFQIEDDILDVAGSAEDTGKNTGNDEANEKCTYVSLMGLERAREEASRLTEKAGAALEPYGERARNLIDLAVRLAKRGA